MKVITTKQLRRSEAEGGQNGLMLTTLSNHSKYRDNLGCFSSGLMKMEELQGIILSQVWVRLWSIVDIKDWNAADHHQFGMISCKNIPNSL